MRLAIIGAVLFLATVQAGGAPRYTLQLFDSDHCTENIGTLRERRIREGQCIPVGNDVDSLRYTSTKRGPKNNCKLLAYDGNDDCYGNPTVLEPRGTRGTLAGLCLADYESFRYVCD